MTEQGPTVKTPATPQNTFVLGKKILGLEFCQTQNSNAVHKAHSEESGQWPPLSKSVKPPATPENTLSKAKAFPESVKSKAAAPFNKAHSEESGGWPLDMGQLQNPFNSPKITFTSQNISRGLNSSGIQSERKPRAAEQSMCATSTGFRKTASTTAISKHV